MGATAGGRGLARIYKFLKGADWEKCTKGSPRPPPECKLQGQKTLWEVREAKEKGGAYHNQDCERQIVSQKRQGRHCGTNACRIRRWLWTRPCEGRILPLREEAGAERARLLSLSKTLCCDLWCGDSCTAVCLCRKTSGVLFT